MRAGNGKCGFFLLSGPRSATIRREAFPCAVGDMNAFAVPKTTDPDDVAGPLLKGYRVRCLSAMHVMDYFVRKGMDRDRILAAVEARPTVLADPDHWISLDDFYRILENCQDHNPFLSLYDWERIGLRISAGNSADLLKWAVSAFGLRTFYSMVPRHIRRLNNYQRFETVALTNGAYDTVVSADEPVARRSMGITVRWSAGVLASMPPLCGIFSAQAHVLYDQARFRNVVCAMHGRLGLDYRERGSEILVDGRPVAKRIRLIEAVIGGQTVYSEKHVFDGPFNAVLLTAPVVCRGRVLIRKGEIFDAPYGRVRIVWTPPTLQDRMSHLFRRPRLTPDTPLLRHLERQIELADNRYFESEKLREREHRAVASLQAALKRLQHQRAARRQAEKVLSENQAHVRSLMESAVNFAVYRLSVDATVNHGLRVVFASPSINNLMGDVDTERFETWFANIHPEDADRVCRSNQRAFETFRFDEVFRTYHASRKEWRWIHATSTGIPDPEGATHYVNGLLVDVTDKKRAEAELERKISELEEANTTLNVLLASREQDRAAMEKKIMANVSNRIIPLMKKLDKAGIDPSFHWLLTDMETALREIISPFAQQLTSPVFGLTATEIQLAHLIRQGRTSREIGRMLSISRRTVDAHRHNLRRKLGLDNRRSNLRTFLLSLDA